MAHRRNVLLLGMGVTVVLLLAGMLLPRQVEVADRGLLNMAFHVRGERAVDSSVVILYFSSDDISILGDLPLKRSYYALLVDALHTLGAQAIGFDIGFTEHDAGRQEYDKVFADVVRRAGNVVLSGYFRVVGNGAGGTMSRGLSPAFECFPAGAGPEFPYPELLASAAGLGHSNLNAWYDVPAVLRYDSSVIPSLSVEMVRVARHIDRRVLSVQGSTLLMPGPEKNIAIPFAAGGSLLINYAGGMKSIPAFSAISFLKSYDIDKAGGAAPIDVRALSGKIVLIGIIAEGRSAFVATPFDAQFPTVGIHAMAIHNILEGTFLRRTDAWLTMLLSLVIGGACTRLMRPGARFSGAGVALLAAIVGGGAYVLFAAGNIIVPLAQPLAVLIAVPFSLLVYRHRQVGRALDAMATEKFGIQRQLQEKESLLAALERELAGEAADGGREQMIADIKRFKEEVRQLRDKAEASQPAPIVAEDLREFHGILYHPEGPMAGVVDFVRMISDNDAPVLILGESGTGKELIARAIHQSGKRNAKPFIAVNCGALTETLLESELFGHEKGSFTGAVREKPGRFELADEGVIFLDEIGETSEAFQVKLLRVLQEGTFERVGGVEPRRTDVRVIAATNRDIRKAVAGGAFREDLYYRLNVFTVTLPPLRERKHDLPPLIHALVERECSGMSVSIGVMEALAGHPWKGNIRELQSVLKRASILARAENRTTLLMKDLSEEFTEGAAPVNIEESILASLRAKQFSRSAITETAAELGGLNRGTVAEYFRGECFKLFAENHWDILSTAQVIAGSRNEAMVGKAEKKLIEYLKNAVENVNSTLPLDEVKLLSKPKYKNLAQRYHPILDGIIESYYRNAWSFGGAEKR